MTTTPSQEEIANMYASWKKNGDKFMGGLSGLGQKLFGIAPVVAGATVAFNGLVDAVKSTEKSYIKLTDSGASFSNDMMSMTLAAKMSRMELDDFAELISKNGRSLAGLGGSVTRGTENFHKIADEFHKGDSRLRQLGYTTDEMNQLLIDQIGMSRVVDLKNKQSVDNMIKSTTEFAMELDLSAKLTGKSRRELEDEMRDKKTATQREFALRKMVEGKTEEEKAAIESSITSITAMSKSTGIDKLWDDIIAHNGAVTTKTGSYLASLYGGATKELQEARKAAMAGNKEEAKQRMENARALVVQRQSDPGFSTLVQFSDHMDGLGDAVMDSAITMKPLRDGVAKLTDTTNSLVSSQQKYKEAIDQIVTDLRQSQQGIRDGQKVSQFTETAVNVAKAAHHIEAGIAHGFDEHLAPKLRTMLDPIASSIPQNFENKVIEAGDKLAELVTGPDFIGQLKEKSVEMYQNAVNSFKNLGKDIDFAGTLNKITENANQKSPEPETKPETSPEKGRDTGSIGKTGKIVEDFGKGTQITAHGFESILTQEQLGNLAKGNFEIGSSQAIKTIQSELQTMSGKIITNIETGVTELMTDQSSPVISGADNVNYEEITAELRNQMSNIQKANENADIEDRNRRTKEERDRQNSGLYTKKANTTIEQVKSDIKSIVPTDMNTTNNVAPDSNRDSGNKVDMNAYDLMNGNMEYVGRKSTTTPPDNKQQTSSQQQQPANVQTSAPPVAAPETKQQNDTLNSMLDQLKQLNANITRLISQHEELGRKQVKATKQLNGNAYYQ